MHEKTKRNKMFVIQYVQFDYIATIVLLKV